MRSLVAPGLLLGLGLGGFFDGIVLHQILQWHHMLTSEGSYPATTVAGLEVNTMWDGLFHASTYVFTTVGAVLLVGGLALARRGERDAEARSALISERPARRLT